MSDPDQPKPVISALPDIESTPTKKPRLSHLLPSTEVPNSSTSSSSVDDGGQPGVEVPTTPAISGLGPDSINSPSHTSDNPVITFNHHLTEEIAPQGDAGNDKGKGKEVDGGGDMDVDVNVDAEEVGDTGKQDGTPGMATSIPLPEEVVEAKEEVWFDLRMSWSGKVYEMRVGGSDMVYDFRATIESLTSVPSDRQKLIGLTKGKLSAELDSTRFGTLGVKSGSKFTMIGTPEEMRFKDPSELVGREVADDFDVTYPNKSGPTLVAPRDDPRNKRKVAEKIKACPITVMNEPRPGKRLLVLDLDYTLVDTKPLIAGSLPADECARPGMHEFLELVYPHYDIVIWSQTHWRWLESKIVELGIVGGERNYKICFVADRTPMFPVFTERNGQPYKHEVKPLAYFWASYPHWSPKNSIHIDDLSRNFALNPGEGLRIRAFNEAGTIEGMRDTELTKLGTYLINLAEKVEDFTTVDHSVWKGPRKSRPKP